jgi:hypothetical protein
VTGVQQTQANLFAGRPVATVAAAAAAAGSVETAQLSPMAADPARRPAPALAAPLGAAGPGA